MTTMTRKQNDAVKALKIAGFFLPLLVLLLLFRVYPFVQVLLTSFKEGFKYLTGGYDRAGFENYMRAFRDEYFLQALKNTLVYAAMTTGLTVGISIPTAWCLYRTNEKSSSVYQTLIFLPFITSDIAVGMVWRLMFSDAGLVNYLMECVGLNALGWLTNSGLSLVTLTIFGVWSRVPMTVLILYCALLNLDRNLIIAGQTNGAGELRIFRSIVFPLLQPTVALTFNINGIALWLEIGALFPLFSGAPGPYNNLYLMVYYIYEKMHSGRTFALACAVSILLLVCVAAFIGIVRWIGMGRRAAYEE